MLQKLSFYLVCIICDQLADIVSLVWREKKPRPQAWHQLHVHKSHTVQAIRQVLSCDALDLLLVVCATAKDLVLDMGVISL